MPTQALVLLSQLNGAQMIDGPDVQLPAPSQTRMPPIAAPLQVPGWQTVPSSYVRQPPLPSQVPSSPQVETGLCGQTLAALGATPAATNEQMPGAEGVLQDLQVSVQALLQQTPSTQKPLVQSASQPQAVPLVLRAPPSPHDLRRGRRPPCRRRPTVAAVAARDSQGRHDRQRQQGRPAASFAGNHPHCAEIQITSVIGYCGTPRWTLLVVKEDDLDAVVLGASGR